jgi:molybdenum cofactor cytidylyltransferase
VRIAALILAAGQSTRFGAENKLLAHIDGEPMLAHVIALAKAAGLADIHLVTGHDREAVERVASQFGLRTIHNPDFAEGISASIRAGIAGLPEAFDGALVMLGDMPRVRPLTIRSIVAAARENPAASAIVPSQDGQWGNPVLLRRALFADVARLSGDFGARKLLRSRGDVTVIAVDDPGIHADFDTKAALARNSQ